MGFLFSSEVAFWYENAHTIADKLERKKVRGKKRERKEEKKKERKKRMEMKLTEVE